MTPAEKELHEILVKQATVAIKECGFGERAERILHAIATVKQS